MQDVQNVFADFVSFLTVFSTSMHVIFATGSVQQSVKFYDCNIEQNVVY